MFKLGVQKNVSAIFKVMLILSVALFSVFALFACGKSDSKKIDKIVITQTKVQLIVGASEQLTLTLTPSNISDANLVFASANSNVATVTREGVVTAVGVGETTVSVTATKGGASAVVPVVVITDPITLNKVGGLTFDGEKIVWDRVENNYGYEVTINGVPYEKTVVTECFTDFEVGIENTISVRALGNGKAYLDGECSDEFVFTQLATPTISIDSGTINIVPNSDATNFEILLNGKTHKSKFSYLRYIIEDDLDAGFYAFKVRALGNTSQNTYNSSFSNTITVTKLTAPTSAQVEDRVLTFNSIVGAQSYNIKVINVQTEAVSILSIPATSSFVECDLGEGYEAGKYNIYVMAVGDKRTTLDSAYSTDFAVDKLSKPTNLEMNNGVLTWSTIEHATGYALTIEHNGEIMLEEDIVDPRFEFANKYLDAGEYSLSVTATGGNVEDVNRFVNSDSSAILAITKLATPSSVSIHGDDIVWGEVDKSYGYVVLLDDSLSLPVQTQTYIDIFDTATQTFVAKKYTLRTKALGNNKEIIDSEYSEIFEFRKVGTIDTTKTTLDGGMVTWQGVADVLVYDVYINESADPLRVSGNYIDFSDETYDEGSYSIKVKAISTDNLSVSGEQSEAITFTKLPSPSEFELISGVLYYEMPSGASYSGYNLRVGRTEYTAITDEYLDFDKYLSDGEQQTISLQAIGDGQGTVTSNFSKQIKLRKVSSAVALNVDKGVLSWTAQDGATGYELQVDYATGDTTITQTKLIDGASVTVINLLSDAMFQDAGDYTMSVKSVGATTKISNFEYTYDVTSRGSSPISVKKLAHIAELRVESGLIVWDAVDGVTYYEVVVDGVSRGSECGTTNNFFVIGSAGYHTVCVYARGNETTVLDALKFDNTITVKKLSNVFNLHISDASVQWDGIDGANSYDVDVVDENNVVVKSAYAVASTSYTFYGLDGGKSYYVRVRANGNDSNTVSGDFGAMSGAQLYEVKILSAPRNLRVENNTLYFDYVANAVKYQLVFSLPESQDTQTLVPVEGQTQGTFDVKEYLRGKRAGSYSIFMRAIDDSETQVYVSSTYTSSISILKLQVPVLSVSNGVLQYTQIYSASEYDLGIRSASEVEPTVYTNKKDVLQFKFDTRFSAGEYSVSITAKGNGSTTFSSETSEEFTVEKLRTPVASTPTRADIEVKHGKLVWSAVENATLYTVYVYKYDSLSSEYKLDYTTYLQPKEQNEYLPVGELGSYKVAFSVKGDDTKYVDSDIYEFNKKLNKLSAPSNLSVKDGALSWTSNSNALNGYELIINDVFVEVGSVNTFELAEGYSAINYSVMIRSVGDDVDTLTSDLSDVVSARKYQKLELYIEDGVVMWDGEYARAYNVIVTDEDDVQVENFETTETTYKMTGIDSGYYNITIRQLGTLVGGEIIDYLNSDVSEAFGVYKLATPSDLHINSDFTTTDPAQLARNGYLEWNGVENTSSYYLSYTFATLRSEEIELERTYYKFDDDTLWVGEYQFGVYAGGTTVLKGTTVYECVNSDEATIDAAKLSAPTDLSVSNGVFYWDKVTTQSGLDVKYMFCYYYAEDGQEFNMDEINIEFAGDVNFHTLNKLGKYKLLVYAVGANCIQSDRAELDDDYLFNLFSEGSGSRTDPYIIKTFTINPGSVIAKTYTAYEQLKYVNYLYDKHFKLMEDIVIDSTFEPIGTLDALSFANLNSGYQFEGTLDGNNHTIYFDSASGTTAFGGVGNFGLISSISEKGVVRNLTLSDFVVSGSYNKIGIVTAKNEGVIKNVKVINSSGGITSTFTGGNVETYAGGIAGENTGKIEGCVTKILINATNTKTYVYAGGIVGYNLGSVVNCETLALYGAVNPIEKQIQGAYVGGIAGCNVGKLALVDGCKNSASMTAMLNRGEYGNALARAGGIVGVQKFEEVSETGLVMPMVSNCYNVGMVNALASGSDSDETGSKVGGIVGFISGGTVDSCYNVGTLYTYNSYGEQFNTSVGAIVGWNNNSEQSYVINCFHIAYSGIPLTCSLTMQKSEMTLVSEAALKADDTATDAIINQLNQYNGAFVYNENGYPKLNWEA